MNTLLWVLQILLALIFTYSGVCKLLFSEKKLVAIGQTGVEGLPVSLIRFIGLAEILGSIGIIMPWLIKVFPVLTPISAICFAIIMASAAIIHYKRIPLNKKEANNVLTNVVIFVICLFVAFKRFG
jgi:uncharacterized membrane protein YphA (DoxX/SURF4 family)